MTLVVAKKIKRKLIILSDTLISSKKLDGKINCTHRFTPDDSAIKSIIINPNLCFSFAGDVCVAKQALSEVINKQNNKNEILDILYKYNQNNFKDTDKDTDFIIYFGKPYYDLYVIKNGDKPLNSENCYIGNSGAYKLFKEKQENNFMLANGESVFKLNKIPESFSVSERTIYSKINEDFLYVIESNIKSVGGFVVSMVYENNNLCYMPYFISNKTIVEMDELPVIEDWQIKYDIGKNEKGDYSENFICTNSDFIAIHMPLVNLGYIYEKDFSGFMSPKKMIIDEIDFFDILEKTKGVDRNYSLLLRHNEQHFTIKANNFFDEKKYNKAIKFYDRAIVKMFSTDNELNDYSNLEKVLEYVNEIENKEKSQYLKEGLKIILHMRGLAYYNEAINNNKSNRYKSLLFRAQRDFNVVLKIDSKYEMVEAYCGSIIALLSLI